MLVLWVHLQISANYLLGWLAVLAVVIAEWEHMGKCFLHREMGANCVVTRKSQRQQRSCHVACEIMFER